MSARARSQTFSKRNGGLAKIAKERKCRARLTDRERENEEKKYSAQHDASSFDDPPILPWHHVVFDPMHALHNEGNVILDEVRPAPVACQPHAHTTHVRAPTPCTP